MEAVLTFLDIISLAVVAVCAAVVGLLCPALLAAEVWYRHDARYRAVCDIQALSRGQPSGSNLPLIRRAVWASLVRSALPVAWLVARVVA